MIRQPLLERAALNAVRSNALVSTNEIVRVLVRGGKNTGRQAVSKALRVLEADGLITNVGGLDSARWTATP